ncbi:hypothetical protein [Verminephrobacter aporrectodeae]|nr:hypothetical protein [Verminephrobacter aporrectodeae]
MMGYLFLLLNFVLRLSFARGYVPALLIRQGCVCGVRTAGRRARHV